MGDVQANGARRRPLPDDDVDGVVFHGGIEDLFDRTVETVYLVDEEDVAFLEIGEDGRKIARAIDGGAGGRAYLHPHLVCHDAGKRRLAQTRGAREEQVVKRLATHARGFDEHGEVVLDAALPQIVIQRLGTQALLGACVLG